MDLSQNLSNNILDLFDINRLSEDEPSPKKVNVGNISIISQ